MSTDTPTPRTDVEITDEHRFFARQIHADCQGSTIARDEFDEAYCAKMLAERDELTSQHWADLLKQLADMQARAEAAEAACVEKNTALKIVLADAQMVDLLNWSSSPTRSVVKNALSITPAETRSVIAGLREELARLRDDLNHERKTQSGEHLRCIAQRDALISAGELYRKESDNLHLMEIWDAAVSGAQAGAKGGNKS